MENLPSINEILENQYFQVGMIVWVVFFSGCITSMVPDNVRRLLDNPVVKVGVLALVVYLAEKDFKLAVVVAAGFFLSTAPLDVKEGMACSGSPDSVAMNSVTCNLNTLGTECSGESHASCVFTAPDYLAGELVGKCNKDCSKALCATDCNLDSSTCAMYKNYDASGTIQTNESCGNRCNLFDNQDDCNNKSYCRWAKNTVTDNKICSVKCDQHATEEACNNSTNAPFCTFDNSSNKCVPKPLSVV